MNADGSGQAQLTNNDLDEQVPPFTADGRIVFARCVSGPRGCDIWIMNADGSGQRNLTDFDDWQGYASSSPSGNKLAFHWCGGGVDWCQIFTMKSDGSALTQLTHADAWVSTPDWSPNGNQIAYVTASNKGDIMLMKSNGDGVRNLTNTPDLVENFPQWSPDGTKIVYTDNDGSDGSGHIWIVDVASGLRSMLFSFAPPRDYAFGYPDWQLVAK